MKEPKYFLYVGNAYPHKNLGKAIEAICDLNEESRDKVEFYIVSARNVFTRRLERLVRKLNAQNLVKLLGFVPDEKLQKLYEKSVGFIYPSLVEGFGLPGLEAMKAGTLLLCSDIPVFREVYEEKAIYFDPTDLKSIRGAMQNVLDTKDNDRRKKIEKAREFLRKYSWTKMAEKTHQVYKDCYN